MNKFAKLKAVNRLLVKVADVAPLWPPSQTGTQTTQTTAPVGPVKPQLIYADKFTGRDSTGAATLGSVQTGSRGAGIGQWADLFNVSSKQGYGYGGFRPYKLFSFMKRKYAPGRTSLMLQNLRKELPADVLEHDKAVPAEAFNAAMRKTVPAIGQYIQGKADITKQTVKDNYPWISNISKAKAWMQDPKFLVQAGVIRPNYTSQQVQKARLYWRTRGSQLLRRYGAARGLNQQQMVQKGYMPTPDLSRGLFREGSKKGKRLMKYIGFNASNKPKPSYNTNYMQNNTAIG